MATNTSGKHSFRSNIERLEARDVPAAFQILPDTRLGPQSQVDFVTADFDGDGKADAAVVSRSTVLPTPDHKLTILRGNGDGSFADPVTFLLPPAPDPIGATSPLPGAAFPDTLLAARLDGDALPDLVLTMTSNFSGGFARGQVLTFRNTSTSIGSISFAAPVSISPSAAEGTAAANFLPGSANALDLVTANANGGGFTIHRNDGSGSFTPTSATANLSLTSDLYAADFDGDGKNDFAALNAVSGQLEIRYGLGNGTFETPTTFNITDSTSRIVIGNFNSDGKLDLAILNSLNNGFLSLNANTGNFRSYTTAATSFYDEDDSAFSGASRIAAGDFNLDGRDDIVVLRNRTGVNSFFTSNPDGTVTPDPDNPYPIGGEYSRGSSATRVRIADFDGDRNLDTLDLSPLTATALPNVSRITPFLNLAADPTVLTSAPTVTIFGSNIVLSATITPLVPPITAVPPLSGTVTFTLNGIPFVAPINGNTATVLVPTNPNFPPATYAVTARYDGNAAYRSSATATTAGVMRSATVATINANPNTLIFGDTTTVTIRVTDPEGNPVAGGFVDYFRGPDFVATLSLDGNGFAAPFGDNGLPAGTFDLRAVFNGDNRYLGSSAATTVTVTPAPTTTNLVASPNPADLGTTVNLLATVFGPIGLPTPIGFVEFFNGAASLGQAALTTDGTAALPVNLPVGTSGLRAVYLGETRYLGSASQTVTQVINRRTLGLSLSATPNPSAFTRSVQIVAVLTRPAGFVIPTGGIEFFAGTESLGTATLDATGRATISTTRLPVGTTELSATYIGSETYFPIRSNVVRQTVLLADTRVTLAIVPPTGFVGRTVELIAAVSVPSLGRALVNGPVPFTNAIVFRRGEEILGRVSVATDGTARLSTTTLPIGPSDIRADYEGDANFAAARSAEARAFINDLPTIAVGSDNGAVVCVFDNLTNLRHGITDFGPEFAGVRPVTADLTGDGIADIVAGNGPGSPNRFTIIDGATKLAIFTTQPFENAYTGGIFLAVGDIDGDGRVDVVVAPDAGGGSRVQVYRNVPNDFVKIADQLAFLDDADYRGGLRLAVGDVDRDGFADVILSAGDGGGPRVAGLSGRSLARDVSSRLFGDFFAFESGLRIGAYVAVTDFNGDGFDDVIVGAGVGGAPRVSVYHGELLGTANHRTVLADFFAGDSSRRGGIRVAGRDLDLDGRGDIITGSGRGDGSTVNVFFAKSFETAAQPNPAFGLEAFPTLEAGVYVG